MVSQTKGTIMSRSKVCNFSHHSQLNRLCIVSSAPCPLRSAKMYFHNFSSIIYCIFLGVTRTFYEEVLGPHEALYRRENGVGKSSTSPGSYTAES